MRVNFQLAMQYAEVLGTDTIQVWVDAVSISLGDCLQVLLSLHPVAQEKFETHNLLQAGQITAMFIRQEAIISLDEIVSDGDTIRIMLPISGG